MRDRGPGFDPDALPEMPDVEDPRRMLFEHGLGITLMRKLVDKTDIQTGDDGTLVRLVIDTSLSPGEGT